MIKLESKKTETVSRCYFRRPVLYADVYLWFVFLSAMDVMLTTVILHMGGREVNVLASLVLQTWNLSGLVVYKFVLVAFVLTVCEAVGRADRRKGRWLAVIAVAITAVPVILSFIQCLHLVVRSG